MISIEKCPFCEESLIIPVGPNNSEILFVGSSPGEQELVELTPFVGWTGWNFRRELALVGIDYYQCRTTNLYNHKPSKNEECFNFGLEQVIKEAIGKKLILLMGAETVSTFTGYKVSTVCGLWVDSSYFSVPVMCMFNPAQLTHGGLGEIRLSLKKFILEVEKLE